jgi:hypothetical protein
MNLFFLSPFIQLLDGYERITRRNTEYQSEDDLEIVQIKHIALNTRFTFYIKIGYRYVLEHNG